jgi:hypothetical protein
VRFGKRYAGGGVLAKLFITSKRLLIDAVFLKDTMKISMASAVGYKLCGNSLNSYTHIVRSNDVSASQELLIFGQNNLRV